MIDDSQEQCWDTFPAISRIGVYSFVFVFFQSTKGSKCAGLEPPSSEPWVRRVGSQHECVRCDTTSTSPGEVRICKGRTLFFLPFITSSVSVVVQCIVSFYIASFLPKVHFTLSFSQCLTSSIFCTFGLFIQIFDHETFSMFLLYLVIYWIGSFYLLLSYCKLWTVSDRDWGRGRTILVSTLWIPSLLELSFVL